MSAIRSVPVGQRKRGQCTWCSLPVVHEKGPKVGEPNLNRTWHSKCAADWKLHAMRDVQVAHVAARDGHCCAQCGAKPRKFVSSIFGRQYSQPGPRTKDGMHFTPVRPISTLELDHRIPLWSVAHLSDADRRKYFGPENLWLLCGDCHKAKTSKEAAWRSRFNQERKASTVPA